nr:MAG TPA: minor tail protein [Bacteriophage sp.]
MGKRGPSAQYAYGITIEAGNYNEVINGFEKRLKNLDKVTATTTKTFAALSEAMKSGKQVDFSKAEGQLTGLVTEMEEVAKWREQLAGGQKLSDMFDGLEQVKQSLGQVTGQLDKFGDNIEEIFSILQNVPQNTSKTFVDVRKVLQRQASDMSKIIAELNNPTEKTDVSALKNQLSGLTTDFVNEWNKATSQGIKMDQVVDFKPFANIIKTAINGARSLGAEFNDVSASVTEATRNVVELYNVKHPTGMFKDIATGMSNIETQSKKAEQAASKVGASFKAAISIVDKINKSDMGLAKKSKEMDEFLAKLKNPEITINLKNKDVEKEFEKLTDIYEDIVGFNDITPDFLKSLSVDKLEKLGTTLQNIVAIGKEFPEFLDIGDDVSIDKVIGAYNSDLKKVIEQLTTMLNEASESTKKLQNNLQQMLEKAGLKDIKLELDVPTEDEIDTYIGKINSFIDKIVKQADRIKKIPVMLAFDNNDSDENKNAIETLKQNLEDLKKTIHDARTEINQDTKAIKQSIFDALNVNAKDMVNVRAALEDAFNIEPLEILINDEFLVNQIQNALKNKIYDISLNANINGANYSGGGIPVSRVSGGGVPATQQSTAADKQEHASESQNKAAEEQKSAAQINDKSAQLLSKASQEMTAFVKKFANTYYKAKSQQKELDNKVASGKTLTDKENRRLSRVSGVVRNLNPINEYLKGIFGDKVNLSKITEDAMSKVLTSLMQSNGKGSFKGELLSEDLLGLFTGLKGKYRSKYGNGIGDLLSQLVGTGGKNGTLDAMFKSFGLNSATFAQTSARDYTAPDVLKYYQSFARLADIIDEIKIHPQNASNELLTELANILKGMQNRTTSEEYRANITEISNSINALATNIKDYNAKVIATADLDTKEGEDYTPLLNMFKELYSKVDEATKATISSAIGANPSEDIIKGDQLVKAREALSTISGDEASSKIASDLLRWLDRMIASDNVVLSRETLLSQLGKGQKGSGLKVATSKNGKGKMTAYGIANNVLSDLDADIYYDGMGNPIVINRKDSPTQKRKSLRMIKNLGASGRRFANGTQIYNKDNPRPKIEDERRPESSIEGGVDWGKRLALIDAELAKTSSEYEAAIKKRDETIQKIEQKEQEISKQIDVARKNVEEAKGNFSEVSKGVDIQDSGDIDNIKSAIRDREKLYNLMVEMDKSYIPDFELSKRNVPVSDTYKQLIEERKKVSSRIKAAKGTSDFYKKIENGTSEDKSRYVKTAESKVSEIEASLLQLNTQLAEAEKVNDDSKINHYKKLIVDKTNELESARDKLSNYQKIASGQTVSTEYDSRVTEQENILANLNSQINDELDSQKQQMDKDTYSLLLKIIEQYKERQGKLKGLEKDLSKYKEDSKEHDNILVQIDSLKTNLNSMVDEISEISSTMGLDNKDLENAFSSMSSDDFFSSKDTRKKLEKEVQALSTFKKDSLADISIFPPELQEVVKKRNELLTNKSDLQYINKQLKDLKIKLYEAKSDEREDDVAYYEERIKILTERKKDLGFVKNIEPELKKLDSTILSYISSRVDLLKDISKTDFDIEKLPSYKSGNTAGKYQKDVSDKSFILAQLEQEAKLLAKNKENANSDVASLENKRKVLEKQRELAQLQVDYNTKRMEELQLTEEIASLEKSDPSSEVLAQKRQQLEAINAELSKMYAQIHTAGSTTSSEILDENISADQKKLIALEKIIEAQKIIAQNEEMQNRARAKIKDSSSISNIKHDSETGKFTTQYGNESKLTRYTSDRFRSIYTQSDEFTQFRSGLYEKARKKISSVESSLSQQITEIIDNMSKDAIGKIVKSKYGTSGAKAHETSWRISLQALDTELREALEKREYAIYSEYNEYISNISAADSLSPVQKENKISKALIERDSKISSLYSGGTEFKSVFDKKAQKFTQYYYRTLENLLGESQRGLGDAFLKDILRQFKQLTMTSGKGGDNKQKITEFGKRVSNIFNQADTKSDEIIKKIYEVVDKKLEENIVAYMKEISSDETRLEGELANDVVFKDRMGNRINLAAEYRNANQYNLDRVTSLGQENKAQKEWISKLREYGGISDEEMKYIQEAKERALLKVYGGSESEIKNLDILIGDVDTTPIEEATTSIANQTIKAAAEVAKKAADDKLSTPTVPETASVQQAEQKVAEQVVESAAQSAEESVSKESKTTTKTSAEYKDAVKIVKEAIGGFRGRTDKSKAEFYSTLGKEVKDAANLIYRTPAENRTKEGNALLNKMIGLKNATQEKQKQTAEEVKQTTEKQKQTAEEVKQTAEQQKQVELSNAEKLKLAKKELQNRIDTAKEIAQDGTKSKSKEVIKSGSVPSAQNPEYVFNEGVESTSEFVKEVWNLTEAFKAGANAANIEYGFATQNGKRIQLAKGNNGSVDFQRFYGDVDSLTHSHSYTKGLNNMVFSLEDINQLEQLGTRNNLKKYNLIYDNEMMSLNLGKNSQEAAEAIADCYPQINDVVMAMLSREDGNSIPAENSDEMARILNGYLQKVVEDAGGRLSVVNSKGENVTSKYFITDDEYSKLNNILAKSQNYYNDNFGTASKSDYVSVIRQYIAEEFGKEFMANVRAKSDTNPHGGVYTEFSAIPEYDDEDKKMLDYAEQVTLYSKKIVAAEKAFVESLQKMSNEDLMAFIKQGEETLGIKKEPEIKPTLTKAQQEALNPNNNSAQVKNSVNEFKKTIGWDSKNIESITNKLGTDALSEYNEKLKELRSIAGEIGEKGKQGIIIENADLERLDRANKEVRELQANLTKIYNKKVLEDDGRLFGSEADRSKTSDNISTRGMLEDYAKQFAASSNSSYDFSNFDIINKKLEFTTTNAQGNITKAIMQWNDSLGAVVLTTDKEYAKLDSVSQKISDIDTLIAKIKSENFLTDSDTTEYASKMEAYKQAVKEVEDYDPKNAAGITLEQKLKELEEAKEALVKAGQNVLDKGKNAYGYNAAQKVSARETDVNTLLGSNFGESAESSAAVEKYRNALKELNDEIEAVKSSGKAWSSDEGIQSKLLMLANNATKAEKELLGVVDASKKLNENIIDTDSKDPLGGNVGVFKNVDSRNANEAKTAMMAYAKSIKGVQLETIKYNAAQKQVTFSVKTGKNEMTDMAVSANQLTNAFSMLNNGTRYVPTGMEAFLDSIGGKLQEVGRYILSFGSFYRIWGEIQKGVTYVREIDSALTELKKVTDETDETYAQFLKTMSQTGAEVGATVKDLTNMAASWARLGYSIQEAGELARSTAVLLNVSEFTDAETASEALISTMQAYGYAAEDSMHVVDVLNEVGNNFAVSSDGIATALQDSASSLMAAGNSLEQSVAMVAAANKVLQDPNSVGSALRTISLRIRGTKVSVLEEMGEETDGVVESISKLQSKVKALSGVDILTDTGAYKDTYTIIKEIAQVWDEMNDIDRAALLELLAGKNRSNAMAAMLTNLEDLEGAYESAMKAQGSAEAENKKYMDSIQGRIDQFNNALQTMWSSELDSGFVKGIVSIGTWLVKLIDTLGLFPSILATIGTVKLGKIFLPQAWALLTNAVTTHIAALSGETAAIEALNGAKVKAAILDSTSISNDAKEIAIKTLLTGETGNETVVTDLNTVSKIKAALAQQGLNDAQIAGVLSAMGLTTVNVGLGTSFKLLAANIWKSIKAMAAFVIANPWILVVAGITAAIAALVIFTKTHKDYVKTLKDTTDKISEVRNKIQSLNDELKTTQDRINELELKDKLSFTEKEELKNLKAQNAELERSIRLEEEKEKRLQKKAAKNLNDAVKSDSNFGGASVVYRNPNGEYVSSSEAMVWQGSGNQTRLTLQDGYSEEAVSSLDAKIIEFQVAQRNLDKAKEELDNLSDDASDQEFEDAEKKVEQMQKIADNKYEIISNVMDKINEDYLSQEGVEWQYGNPDELEDWQKQMNANLKIIYDAQDRLAIGADNTGKAIEAAFIRVTQQTEFQDELEEIQNTVGITGEKLKEMYEASDSTDNTGLHALIKSLLDCGVIANTSAEELQKVVDLSLELGYSASSAAMANKKLARSQKMLQYYKLYKELNGYTKKLKEGKNLSKEEADQIKKSTSAIRQQMQSLADAISKYDLLGDQINEAKEAFTSFENAKKSSEENPNYIDTAGEMFQAVIDGYHSAEMGSEVFKSAFKGLIPESVYEDLDTLEERYTAAAEYISGTLSRYFNIEYDDDGAIKSVETTTKNIETFIEDAKEKGLMSFSNGVWTVNETDFDNFADKMGITKSMLVAIGEQMDNVDADWIMGDNSSFFDSFDMGTEANIYRTIKALGDLDQQYIDVANSEKATAEEKQKALDDYVQKYSEYQATLAKESNNAIANMENYTAASDKVDACTQKVKDAKAELDKLLNDPNATDNEIQIATNKVTTATQELAGAVAEKGKLTAPSEIEIQVAQESINNQLAEIKAKWESNPAHLPVILEDGKVNSELLELGEDGKYKVALTPKVQDLSEEDKAVLDDYAKLLNSNETLKLYLEGEEDAKGQIEEVKTVAEAAKKAVEAIPDPSVDSTAAVKAINNLIDAVDRIPTSVTVTTTYREVSEGQTVDKPKNKERYVNPTKNRYNINAIMADGTANAQGDWGAEKTETSLVGELGPELRVRGSRWEMLGENGAEFTDVQKGDIIFNHKQTEELFKNGHISSRGKAFVGGTAYAGTSGTIYTGGALAKDYGGTVPDWFNHISFLDNLGSTTDSLSDAADSMSDSADEFEEVVDWFEMLLEEIENNISLMNAQLENAVGINAKKGIYSQILDTEYLKVRELNEGIKLYADYSAKLFAKIPEQYREMAKNGAVAITDFVGEVNEEVVEAINNYREWANKVKDLNQQLEETKKQISETRVQIQEMVKTEYDNEIGLITVKNAQIQGEMSLQEEKGERSSDVYYEAMTKNSTEQLSKLKAQRKEMQEELDKAVKSGDVKKFSDDWYTMVNAIYDVDAAIIDCETDIEGYQNSMNDLHWDNFDKIITEIDNVRDEGEQLRSLIDDDDIADDVGNWTDAGITSIGLLAQEMENAKYRAELYGKEIEQLNKDYKAGKYSTDEYNEKLKELKDSQWDSIDAYESAKKAIIDANKTRIEAVKDGIQKEIDAYDKLISKRKEDLSAQKDAHDFNKNVQDQQKEIDKIQRQLDAMEGDTSAAANAKRKKLQEELYQAQSDLAETYYDHDIETQQKALDDELEAYKQEKEDRMEELDKYLENEDQVLADSLQLILDNADGIDSFLKNISEKYGVSIYDAVVDPWSDGADALSKYLEMLKGLKGEQEGIQKDADKNAKDTVNKINKSTKDTTSAEYVEPKPEPKPSKPSHSSGGSYYAPSSVGVGSAVTVKSSATNFSRDGGNGTKMQGWVPGSTFTVMETSGDQVLIGIPGSGYTGWVNKSDLEGFAKGTKGVKSSQLAMIDENGLEELVLHADGNGKLAFLSKGTSVIPADITENLMKLGSIDPTEMLKRNTPSIGAPHITNNNMELNLEFGSLVHVDNCNQDTIPELQKMVRSEFDNMMKQVNSGLKRYAR